MGSTVKDVMTTQVVAVRKAASFKEMVIKMRDSRMPRLGSGLLNPLRLTFGPGLGRPRG